MVGGSLSGTVLTTSTCPTLAQNRLQSVAGRVRPKIGRSDCALSADQPPERQSIRFHAPSPWPGRSGEPRRPLAFFTELKSENAGRSLNMDAYSGHCALNGHVSKSPHSKSPRRNPGLAHFRFVLPSSHFLIHHSPRYSVNNL
jgi:hypothetical protein